MSGRPIKVHRKARRDNQVAGDIAYAQLVQFARQHQGMFVMERGIATHYYQISIERVGAFVYVSARPERSHEAMVWPKSLQSYKCGREFDRRSWIELIVS